MAILLTISLRDSSGQNVSGLEIIMSFGVLLLDLNGMIDVLMRSVGVNRDIVDE